MTTLLFDDCTRNASETEELGYRLSEVILPELCKTGFVFIALNGELGAGKTAFIRGLMRRFNEDIYVHSPSYTILNEYRGCWLTGRKSRSRTSMSGGFDEDDSFRSVSSTVSVGNSDNRTLTPVGIRIIMAVECGRTSNTPSDSLYTVKTKASATSRGAFAYFIKTRPEMNDLNDKPYILALDSTAVTAAAAVMKGEEILASSAVNGVRTHSETLLAAADALISAAGLKVSDIGLFACAAGPGSFTGVRIGVSLIKGLAYPQNKPCAGVSTLEALAYNLHITARDALIVPVMDARRSQFYNALFLDRAEGRQRRLCADRVLSFDELMVDLLTVEPESRYCQDGYDLAVSKRDGVGLDEIKKDSAKLPAAAEVNAVHGAVAL